MLDDFGNEFTSNLTSPPLEQIAFIVFEESRKSGRRELLITEDEAIAIKIIEGYDISFWDYFQKGKNSNIRRRWYERYKYSDSGWMRFLTDEEIKEIIEDNEYERGELEATGMGIMNMMDSIHGNDAW